MRRPRRYLTAAAVGQTAGSSAPLAKEPVAGDDGPVAANTRSRGNLIDRLRRTLLGADDEWEKAAAKTRPGDLSCREGCFGCCIGSFEISYSEALVLIEAVSSLPERVRLDIQRRAAAIAARGAASFPGDPVAGVLDPERSSERDAAYFDALEHVACPLLELPSGRCAIYSSRPVTCRTYGLAWRENREVVHPACPLNLADATPGHTLETAVDVTPLLGGDQERADLARADGLPSGATTTVAHALTGTAFTGPGETGRKKRA